MLLLVRKEIFYEIFYILHFLRGSKYIKDLAKNLYKLDCSYTFCDNAIKMYLLKKY